MVNGFEFATAARVIFGGGRLCELPALAAEFGGRALLVTGQNARHAEKILPALLAQNIATVSFAVATEPTIALAQSGAELARREGCQMVIALGGGSVIDAGKAIAALATNPGDPLDYLEVIGRAQPITHAPLPFIAVPTTAGTGAEATRNAVLHSPEHRVKVSLRSPLMLPRIALVDPELTRELPPALTASTGLDALTQLIEPFVSKRANPMTDALCRESLPRAARALRRAFDHGEDMEARTDLSLASLHGGMALANAGLGAVHGFAAPIGGMFNAPHGAVCAALLADVMHCNLETARRENVTATLHRYEEVARLLTGTVTATAQDGMTWVRELCAHLHIPRLAAFGLTRADFADVATKAQQSSSMKGNPLALTTEQLVEILERAF